jgi:hypothetical protein
MLQCNDDFYAGGALFVLTSGPLSAMNSVTGGDPAKGRRKMTNTTTLQSAGFIVCDDTAIWGLGDTAETAWADMLKGMREAGIEVVEEKSEDDLTAAAQTEASKFQTGPATAALLRQVEERGGNIAWGDYRGIYCTRDEMEDAHDAETACT